MNVEYEEHDPSEMTRPTIDEEMSGEKMIAGGMQDKILTLALPAKDVNEPLASLKRESSDIFNSQIRGPVEGRQGERKSPGVQQGGATALSSLLKKGIYRWVAGVERSDPPAIRSLGAPYDRPQPPP